MSYDSVDTLQKSLTTEVFHYAKDGKKAAGRALGTLVEIITFYFLRAWDFRDSIAIERPLPEFANPAISHNVEYSLHPILKKQELNFSLKRLPITAAKIRAEMGRSIEADRGTDKENILFTSDRVLRNSCTVWESERGPYIAHLENLDALDCCIHVNHLHQHPYALFECKRVGIEEGMKKGPQTIEKAKQGAYVARAVSALQKIRRRDGQMGGILEKKDGTLRHGLYTDLLKETIDSTDIELLKGFILTVGVVSNHGNWFTAETQNKEMRLLAQSYDWLLFLTDEGLGNFIRELLLDPTPELNAAKKAFLASYKGEKSGNRFTKVTMDADADAALQAYFQTNSARVATWFNVITPAGHSLDLLRNELNTLKNKDWGSIYDL